VYRADGSLSPEFDHMLLKVMLDQPYIADVGFGECFAEPLPLVSGGSRRQCRICGAAV